MANRRLTIFGTALILTTGCTAESTVSPETQEYVGTWNVISEVYTSVATSTLSQNNLLDPDSATVSYMVFYDDNDLLFLTHYADTLPTAGGTPLGVDSDAFVFSWCVIIAPHTGHKSIGHDHSTECGAASATQMIIDEFGTDEVILDFVRNGDNMVLRGAAQANLTYDFGSGTAEPATVEIVMERIILVVERPDVVRCVSAG